MGDDLHIFLEVLITIRDYFLCDAADQSESRAWMTFVNIVYIVHVLYFS
jgi:hypothetical protein